MPQMILQEMDHLMASPAFWTEAAAIGQLAAAVIILCALLIALRQGKLGREQFLRASYNDARPILIVSSEPKSIKTQQLHGTLLDWQAQQQIVKVRNVGKGLALSVRSVIYGPEPLRISQQIPQPSVSLKSGSNLHWYCWKSDVISSYEERELNHYLGNSVFDEKNKHIQQYSFNAPLSPLPANPGIIQELTRICRISITYHDIFHRKHASIFDLVHPIGWQVVDLLENIPHDLHDLEQK